MIGTGAAVRGFVIRKELHRHDRKISPGYVARIAAGFCWPWSKPRPDGTLVDDVTIGSWSRPWNLLSDKALNGIPPSALWATDDAGFGQVGCVYTAQGFEYEYGGVIIGGDLVWRDDHWETRPAESRDRDIKRRQLRRADPQRLQGPAHPWPARLHDLLRGPGNPADAGRARHPVTAGPPLVAEISARPADSLSDLAATVRAFARARDWEQYHTPKNLAVALAGEAGELLACFQWLTPGESARIMHDPSAASAVESELADVLQYLIRLADVLGIDLAEAVRKKVGLNETRFPPNQPG